MKIRLFILFIAFIVLSACIQQENNGSAPNLEKHEGTIVHVEKEDGQYYMLVISDIDSIDLSNKSKEELEELAREKDGSYYHIDADKYDELDLATGKNIIAYFDGQGDSAPPVRDAQEVELVSQ